MATLLQDLRYGLRLLVRSPGLTAAAVLALALGIGATTAIFSVVNAVLLRPLPLDQPERLIVLNETFPTGWGTIAWLNYLDWRSQNRVFENMAVYTSSGLNLTGRAEPQRLRAAFVSEGFFATLRARPALGRAFLAAEHQRGRGQVVLLSDGLWRRHFGADRTILGSTLTLNGKPYTVIGVMPPSFDFPGRIDLWAPYTAEDPAAGNRGSHFLRGIARLPPGVRLEQAQAEMATIAKRLEQQYPDSNAGRSVRLAPLPERVVGAVRPALLTLLAAVAFVLLIACANVANLLLARATSRRREIAVRIALGAGRLRLLRQLLTESVLLALGGALLGLMLARWGLEALLALAPPDRIPRLDQVAIDSRVLAFTVAVAVLTGVIFGLAPALQATRLDLNQALKQSGSRSAAPAGGGRLRSALVVSEMALALVLLIAGGLSIKAFLRLERIDPGFDPVRVLTMRLHLPESTAAEVPPRLAALDAMQRRIEAVPGVEAGSLAVGLPLISQGINGDIHIEGRPDPPPGQRPQAELHLVTPRYFAAMGVPLLRGRDFTERDVAGAPNVCIINRSLARRFWGGPDGRPDPIGRRVAFEDFSGLFWMQVIGVAADVHQFTLDRAAGDELYMPLAQQSAPILAFLSRVDAFSLVVRGRASDPALLTAAVQTAIHSVDKDLPVSGVQTMHKIVSDSVAQPRLASTLLGVFSAIALLLAAAGVFAVMAYLVTQRTPEIGVRMALGARPRDIARLVLVHALRLALLGIALGLAAAFGLTRLLASQLYGLSATDPVIFAGVPLLLAAVALAASYLPARRAARVDPMIALRYE